MSCCISDSFGSRASGAKDCSSRARTWTIREAFSARVPRGSRRLTLRAFTLPPPRRASGSGSDSAPSSPSGSSAPAEARAAAASSSTRSRISSTRAGSTNGSRSRFACSCSSRNRATREPIPGRSGAGIASAKASSESIATSRSRRSPSASASSFTTFSAALPSLLGEARPEDLDRGAKPPGRNPHRVNAFDLAHVEHPGRVLDELGDSGPRAPAPRPRRREARSSGRGSLEPSPSGPRLFGRRGPTGARGPQDRAQGSFGTRPCSPDVVLASRPHQPAQHQGDERSHRRERLRPG